MTRKDYELIAETLKTVRPANMLGDAQWRRTVAAFADRLRAENPLFDSRRFYKAAGVGGARILIEE